LKRPNRLNSRFAQITPPRMSDGERRLRRREKIN
jgi:hypothetical protein